MWKRIAKDRSTQQILDLAILCKEDNIMLMCSFYDSNEDSNIVNLLPLSDFTNFPSDAPALQSLHNFSVYQNIGE